MLNRKVIFNSITVSDRAIPYIGDFKNEKKK